MRGALSLVLLLIPACDVPELAITCDDSSQCGAALACIDHACVPDTRVHDPWKTETIGQGILADSAPSVTTLLDRRYVFYRGTNGHLWTFLHDGQFWDRPWDLSPEISAAPSAISFREHHVRVLNQMPDGRFFVAPWDGGQWWGAGSLGPQGLTSAPSLIVLGDHELRGYYKGADDQLWSVDYDGDETWQEPVRAPGIVMASEPSAVRLCGAKDVRVFYAGPDQRLWMSSWSAAHGWTGSRDLGGGTILGAPSAISPAPGQLVVFYRDAQGELSHRKWLGGEAWSEVVNHEVYPDSAPSALSPREVYFRRADEQLAVARPTLGALDPVANLLRCTE